MSINVGVPGQVAVQKINDATLQIKSAKGAINQAIGDMNIFKDANSPAKQAAALLASTLPLLDQALELLKLPSGA